MALPASDEGVTEVIGFVHAVRGPHCGGESGRLRQQRQISRTAPDTDIHLPLIDHLHSSVRESSNHRERVLSRNHRAESERIGQADFRI